MKKAPITDPNNTTDRTRVKVARSRLVYEQALKDFPYPDLAATGAYTPREDEALISSKEYLFAGEGMAVDQIDPQNFSPGEKLEGWAVIDFWDDQGEIRIEGVFDIARNGDWEGGRLLPEHLMIFGNYDLTTREWTFWISR